MEDWEPEPEFYRMYRASENRAFDLLRRLDIRDLLVPGTVGGLRLAEPRDGCGRQGGEAYGNDLLSAAFLQA
jgi:hypothetical protein